MMSSLAATLLALLVVAAGAAPHTNADRMVTVASPEALAATASLVASVGGPGSEPLVQALAPRATARSFAHTISPRTLDAVVDFFALDTTAEALRAHGPADLLGAPPFNRSERCNEALDANLTARVVDCYCEGNLPWPTCDAWMHLELKARWQPALARLGASLRQAHQRKLRQSMLTCDGVSELASFDASAGGCLDTYCEADLFGVGSVYGQVSGCSTTVSIPDHEDLTLDDVCSVCGPEGCEDWTVYYLSWPKYSADLLETSIEGEVGVCLELFGLQDLLEDLGVGDALCHTTSGAWWPLKGQVTLPTARVTAGLKKLAGVWVEVGGTIQISDGYSNPLCSRLAPFNDWWYAQDFCCWYAGDGRLTVTVGWDLLFFSDAFSSFAIDTASCS